MADLLQQFVDALETGQGEFEDRVLKTVELAQRNKQFNERKNIRRQEIMFDMTRDTNTLYNNKDVEFRKNQLSSYIDNNRRDMDAETIEAGQRMLENYDYQMSQNSDFNKYKESMNFQMQKVNDFLTKPEFQVGQEYTDKEVEEFRGIFDDYVGFTEEFVSNHADRLQSSGNQYILNELAHGTNANRFMLDSFFNDKKIDKVEYNAYRQAIASNSMESINNYKDYDKKLRLHSSNNLIKDMDENIKLQENLNNVIENGYDLSTLLGKEYEDQSYSELEASDGLRMQIDDMALKVANQLELSNKKHIERHGQDYLNFAYGKLSDNSNNNSNQNNQSLPFSIATGERNVGDLVKEVEGQQDKSDQPPVSTETMEPQSPVSAPKDTVEIYNPGNLRFANQKAATGEDDRGFAIFPSEGKGWQALYNQINLDKTRDMSLKDFIYKYAPPSENDTGSYLSNVKRNLKVDDSENLKNINTKKLAVEIARQEGYGGKFPRTEEPKRKKQLQNKVEPLAKVGEDWDVPPAGSIKAGDPTSSELKKHQKNLSNIASNQFNKLPQQIKKKYKGSKEESIRLYVKDRFKEWLDSTEKYGKGYVEGDFIYFYPTNVDKDNKINKNKDFNLYRLYHPDVFKGATGSVRPFIRSTKAFEKFQNDFNEFREFLNS